MNSNLEIYYPYCEDSEIVDGNCALSVFTSPNKDPIACKFSVLSGSVQFNSLALASDFDSDLSPTDRRKRLIKAIGGEEIYENVYSKLSHNPQNCSPFTGSEDSTGVIIENLIDTIVYEFATLVECVIFSQGKPYIVVKSADVSKVGEMIDILQSFYPVPITLCCKNGLNPGELITISCYKKAVPRGCRVAINHAFLQDGAVVNGTNKSSVIKGPSFSVQHDKGGSKGLQGLFGSLSSPKKQKKEDHIQGEVHAPVKEIAVSNKDIVGLEHLNHPAIRAVESVSGAISMDIQFPLPQLEADEEDIIPAVNESQVIFDNKFGSCEMIDGNVEDTVIVEEFVEMPVGRSEIDEFTVPLAAQDGGGCGSSPWDAPLSAKFLYDKLFAGLSLKELINRTNELSILLYATKLVLILKAFIGEVETLGGFTQFADVDEYYFNTSLSTDYSVIVASSPLVECKFSKDTSALTVVCVGEAKNLSESLLITNVINSAELYNVFLDKLRNGESLSLEAFKDGVKSALNGWYEKHQNSCEVDCSFTTFEELNAIIPMKGKVGELGLQYIAEKMRVEAFAVFDRKVSAVELRMYSDLQRVAQKLNALFLYYNLCLTVI